MAGAWMIQRELAAIVGARKDEGEIRELLQNLKISDSLSVLNGLGEGMARRGNHLATFLKLLPDDNEKLFGRFMTIVNVLSAKALKSPELSAEMASEVRIDAIRLLAHVDWQTAKRELSPVLVSDPNPEFRLAAVRSLAAHSQPEVAEILMKSWRAYTPAIRSEVTEAMFRQPARIQVLLDEIEAKRVKPGDLDSLRTRQLLNHADAKIRERAGKLLKDNLPADRKEVLARYQQALKIEGKAERGREIFKKNCATCHRVAGIGIDVGPDIADSRTRTLEEMLVDILNPNQAIDNHYINFLVTTKNGRSLSGIITAETATSVTLRRAEGQSDTVLRQDIDTIESSGVSLMPEGLEKAINVQDMADLLLFLKNWRYLDGAVPIK
jgi:putative heme-binding domain-containing protein